jgi:hypothetical protein
MTARAKSTTQELGVTTQLGLFEVVEAAPRRKSAAGVDGAGRRSTMLRSLRAARDGRGVLPRLCVKPEEAAHMLGVSRDFFDEHVKPELRIVRRGSRTILIPVAELVRWVERNAARWA